MPSHKNIEANQFVFGSYLWVSFASKSVCTFLFCNVLVCGVLMYVVRSEKGHKVIEFQLRMILAATSTTVISRLTKNI